MKLCVEYIEENEEHWKNIASEEKKKREELWRVDEKVRLENDKRKPNQRKEQTSKKEKISKSKALAGFWKNWREDLNLDESSSQLEDKTKPSSLPEEKEDREYEGIETETKGGGKNDKEGFAHPGKNLLLLENLKENLKDLETFETLDNINIEVNEDEN